MEKVDVREFEELTKKLDKNKYHVGRILEFDNDNKPYISRWNIYRINMKPEEYYDPKNLIILDSIKGHTLKDIEDLLEKIKEK